LKTVSIDLLFTIVIANPAAFKNVAGILAITQSLLRVVKGGKEYVVRFSLILVRQKKWE
jgi:hypothetical protein